MHVCIDPLALDMPGGALSCHPGPLAREVNDNHLESLGFYTDLAGHLNMAIYRQLNMH